jgi:hypothetical protein
MPNQSTSCAAGSKGISLCRKLGRDFFQVLDYPEDLTVEDSGMNMFGAGLIAIMALGAVGAATGAPKAGQCGYAQCWGAVGTGPADAFGFSHGYATGPAAWDVAQNGCDRNCDNIRTFFNSCGAIAEASNMKSWGYGVGLTREGAEALALDQCANGPSNCTIRVWACSP